MKVESVFISDIKVTNRRREDFGDLQGLAESIGKRQLFQPIVITEVAGGELHLVAGERRLRACRDILGWTEIPARFYSDLTDDERNEIELEENLLRKDLTPYEISRNLVKLVETAIKIDKQEAELRSDGERNSKPAKRGRPSEPGSLRRAAERIGEAPSKIHDAQQHVAAVDRYPELAIVAPTQKDAITVAKNLDKLPDTDRSEARSRLMKHDQNTLAALAEKPPVPPRRPAPERSAGGKWRDWLNDTRLRLKGMLGAGPQQLTRQWTNREWDSFLEDLRGFRADLDSLISEMEEQENELRQQAG